MNQLDNLSTWAEVQNFIFHISSDRDGEPYYVDLSDKSASIDFAYDIRAKLFHIEMPACTSTIQDEIKTHLKNYSLKISEENCFHDTYTVWDLELCNLKEIISFILCIDYGTVINDLDGTMLLLFEKLPSSKFFRSLSCYGVYEENLRAAYLMKAANLKYEENISFFYNFSCYLGLLEELQLEALELVRPYLYEIN